MKHQKNNFHVIKHSKLLIKGFAQKLGFGHFVNAGTFRQNCDNTKTYTSFTLKIGTIRRVTNPRSRKQATLLFLCDCFYIFDIEFYTY